MNQHFLCLEVLLMAVVLSLFFQEVLLLGYLVYLAAQLLFGALILVCQEVRKFLWKDLKF